MRGYHAFTMSASGLMGQIKTDIKIERAGKSMDAIGLWDTGATMSAVSQEVIRTLGLPPISRTAVLTPAGQTSVHIYAVDVVLPNSLKVERVLAFESEIGQQGIGMLIGMDIIGLGDFALTTNGGKTTFSFVVPSVGTIDFVPKATSMNQAKQSHL